MISKRNSRSLIWEQDITVSVLQPAYGQAADGLTKEKKWNI